MLSELIYIAVKTSRASLLITSHMILQAHLWTYSVLMKLGPCLVLTILTCWLVRRLWEAERHRQCIQNKPSSVSITTDGRTISANKRKKGVDSSAVVQVCQRIESTSNPSCAKIAVCSGKKCTLLDKPFSNHRKHRLLFPAFGLRINTIPLC